MNATRMSGSGDRGLTPCQHNDYVVLMVPVTDPTTGYLPPGVHRAGWCELAARFAGNGHRVRLMGGLLAACRNLAGAGCRILLLDGSFVSAKPLPGDYDGAWETVGVNADRIDPVLLDFSNRRAAMKAKYFGEPYHRPRFGISPQSPRYSQGAAPQDHKDQSHSTFQ